MRNCLTALVLIIAFAGIGRAADRPDILVADFEGETYGDWKAVGEAFGPGPARGTLPDQMPVSGFQGKRLVNSYHGGDRTTGTLTSPPFRVERRFIRFLIGGGKHDTDTCMNLILDGKIVRTATGPNDKPGGSEALDRQQWDVTELAGKAVMIQVVDKATAGWGHVNVDHIVQTDAKLPGITENASRYVDITKRYLNFPVKNGAKKRRVTVRVDGQTREFEIELADAKPDFWVFMDVAPFRGKRATLTVDRLPEDSKGLSAVEPSDSIKGAEDLYREKYRPQFHFSSRRGWLNDPNGLVFYKGEYHLFYQHNPYGWAWGNMHWGHAVSTDLVRWKELPIALYPKRYGDWAFSGSAVVDRDDTAGFKKGEEDPIVVAYTSTGRGECIAYSTDRGRTFIEYEGNPVVKHDGRDPKLIWHAPTKRWVMAVYDEQGKSQGIAFYASPDLKKWERQSRIDGWFECPELFELPVDGNPKKTRWVVYAADNHYSIGSFDGKEFKAESGKQRGNHGTGFYAAQTFSDIPAEDGRRIQIGWLRVGHGTMPFNQQMSFPTELTLRTTDEGIRLFANPVREIEKLHGKRLEMKSTVLKDGMLPLPADHPGGDLVHLKAEFEVGDAEGFGLVVRGIRITYNAKKQELSWKETAPLKPVDGKVRLQVLVDRTSIEVFANDGRVYMPIGVIPADEHRSLAVFSAGGATKLNRLEVFGLKSAWE